MESNERIMYKDSMYVTIHTSAITPPSAILPIPPEKNFIRLTNKKENYTKLLRLYMSTCPQTQVLVCSSPTCHYTRAFLQVRQNNLSFLKRNTSLNSLKYYKPFFETRPSIHTCVEHECICMCLGGGGEEGVAH